MDARFYDITDRDPAELRRGDSVMWKRRTGPLDWIGSSVTGVLDVEIGDTATVLVCVAGRLRIPRGRTVLGVRPRDLLTEGPRRS
jgi:hypothetical protein